jgi:hypothetical protein
MATKAAKASQARSDVEAMSAGSRQSAANPSGRVKTPMNMASMKKIFRICSTTPEMPASDHAPR